MISVSFPLNSSTMSKVGKKSFASVRIDDSLMNQARTFIEQQPVPPTLTAVLETALREFLDRHAKPVKPAKPSKAKTPD